MRNVILLAMTMAAVPAAAWGDPDDGAQEIRKRAEVARMAMTKARRVDVWVGDEPATAASLEAKSLLRWSNPNAGSVYGEVFLWSVEGRPVAIASIYRWFHPYHDATMEVVSVSTTRVRATEDDEPIWEPQTAGLQFQPLAEAPSPAKTPAARLGQMRSLARRFSAELLDSRSGEEVARELRLLNQPVYRYASEPTGVVDGALFALVEVTDPELWLLVEASNEGDNTVWKYAVARMNTGAMQARLDGKVIQSWERVVHPWKDRRATYTLFSFEPDPVEPSATVDKP
jgi:hypothetical protein